jgi:hypothetical protein
MSCGGVFKAITVGIIILGGGGSAIIAAIAAAVLGRQLYLDLIQSKSEALFDSTIAELKQRLQNTQKDSPAYKQLVLTIKHLEERKQRELEGNSTAANIFGAGCFDTPELAIAAFIGKNLTK